MLTLQALRPALARDLPYVRGLEMPRSTSAGAAGVLALLTPGDQGPEILLTRRADHLRKHSGQIAFPGGRTEGQETTLAAAMREAQEEVRLLPSQFEVAGSLPPLWIPVSDFWVEPHVALGLEPWTRLGLTPQTGEIEAIFSMPLSALVSTYLRKDFKQFPNHTFETPHGELWGATGAMVHNLLARLNLLK